MPLNKLEFDERGEGKRLIKGRSDVCCLHGIVIRQVAHRGQVKQPHHAASDYPDVFDMSLYEN